MKKTLKNILFCFFLFAVFLAYNIFRYRVYGNMNGIKERLIYAAVFICFMIIAGFKARPLPLVSLLLVSGAAHFVDGTFLFRFAPVFFGIFFMEMAAQNTSPKIKIAASIASQGLLGASIAVLAFRLWLMLFRSAFIITDTTLYLILLVIFSVCLVITALVVKIVLTKKYGGVRDFSKQTLFEKFFLPYVPLYVPEQTGYKKKKANTVLPVNFIYILNAIIIALNIVYYKETGFYGAASALWVAAWLFLILATVCFLKRTPLLPVKAEDDEEILCSDETAEDDCKETEEKEEEETTGEPEEESADESADEEDEKTEDTEEPAEEEADNSEETSEE